MKLPLCSFWSGGLLFLLISPDSGAHLHCKKFGGLVKNGMQGSVSLCPGRSQKCQLIDDGKIGGKEIVLMVERPESELKRIV